MSEATKQTSSLEWKWVIVAVIVGLIIVGLSYFVVIPAFHSSAIQTLVLLVGFVVTGAITGYFSPGVTIREVSVGGALVMLITLAMLYGTKVEMLHSDITNFLLLLLGVAFSWVGGWAGEKLQGDDSETSGQQAHGIEWKWVITGVVIGFALNVILVFLGAPMMKFNLNFVLAVFLASFVITGFVVGFKSPGVTLKEPAIAGLISVVLEWFFLMFGINLKMETGYLVSGLAMGFFFSLFGAWLGEKYQASMENIES